VSVKKLRGEGAMNKIGAAGAGKNSEKKI